MMIQLFFSFLQIGAFSFGGGYAAMPLIQAQVVEKHAWLTLSDFADLVTIAEMTPGPIAVNAATFVGNQVAGIPGAVIATLGVILPSCLFVTLLAWAYTKYRSLSLMQGALQFLRPAVVSMIFAAGLTILLPTLFADGLISFSRDCFQSQAVPGAIVIASHLDSVNHALLTRKDIIGLADESGLSGVRFRKMGNVQFHERDLGNTVRLLNYTLIYSGLVNGICAGRFRQRGLYRPRKGRGLRFPQLCPEALRGRGPGLRLLPPVRGK